MTEQTKKGTIKEPCKNSAGQIFGFNILSEDGETYFVHLGDLWENELILYKKELPLNVGDPVEFKAWEPNKKRGFNVKKSKT